MQWQVKSQLSPWELQVWWPLVATCSIYTVQRGLDKNPACSVFMPMRQACLNEECGRLILFAHDCVVGAFTLETSVCVSIKVQV